MSLNGHFIHGSPDANTAVGATNFFLVYFSVQRPAAQQGNAAEKNVNIFPPGCLQVISFVYVLQCAAECQFWCGACLSACFLDAAPC